MAKAGLPQIRFRDSYLLIGAIYDDISPAYNQSADELHKLDRWEIDAKLRAFQDAWRPYEERILNGICDSLNLRFRQNMVDVYAAPFTTSFSSPLILATKYTPDRAIEVLAHELTHVLLYDNTSVEVDSFVEYEQKWRSDFGDEHDIITLIHIPVHAVLQYIFDDVLHEPERTVNDKKACSNHPAYAKAWQYVDQVGYENILTQMQELIPAREELEL